MTLLLLLLLGPNIDNLTPFFLPHPDHFRQYRFSAIALLFFICPHHSPHIFPISTLLSQVNTSPTITIDVTSILRMNLLFLASTPAFVFFGGLFTLMTFFFTFTLLAMHKITDILFLFRGFLRSVNGYLFLSNFCLFFLQFLFLLARLFTKIVIFS